MHMSGVDTTANSCVNIHLTGVVEMFSDCIMLQNMPEVPVTPECPAVDLARSLATIHQICVSNAEELHQLAQTKV